jgi:hypothetical protein
MVYYLDDTLQEAKGLQGLSSPVEDRPFCFVCKLVENCAQKIVFKRLFIRRFRTGLQIGSFPSAGKALTILSKTSPTS